MKSSRYALSKKLRRPNEKKTLEGTVSKVPESMRGFLQHSEDRRLTFAGVCCFLWEELQIWRRWEPKTAENYGRIMGKKVLSHFDSRAFEELDEDDYIELWDKLLRKHLSESDLKGASVVIRGIVELAYEHGLTQTILWGLPMYFAPGLQKIDPMKSKEQQEEEIGNQLAIRMRIPKSVALETELAMTKAMLENSWENGELVAGLIMLCTGARTSEVTGFSYKHLCEVTPGYWALVRYDVSEKDSRHTRGGGKTSNAFRLLPVPNFLVELLLKRKQRIARRFPENREEELDSFPLACKGMDCQIRCTQKELNQNLKRIYQSVGVSEDLMVHAYLDMQEDAALKEECEGKATAYLLRRMFATAAVYCGLEPGEICTLMGHAIEDHRVKKVDFSNPDQFRKLADKVFSRPVIQVFDGRAGERHSVYTGETMQFSGESNVIITVPEKRTIQISAMSLLAGEPVQVTTSGITWSSTNSFLQPEPENGKNLIMNQYLWEQGEKAWDLARDQTVRLKQRHQSETVAKWGQVLEETMDTMAVVPETEKAPHADINEVLLQQEGEGETFGQTAQQEEATERQDQTGGDGGRNTVSWAADETLHILTNQGKILAMENPFAIQKTRLAGKRLSEIGKREKVTGVIRFDPMYEAWILSLKGVLYRVPKGTVLSGKAFCNSKNPAYLALLEGGMFFQGEPSSGGKPSIVCLADTGRIRRMSTLHLNRIPENGRQLVRLEPGETLVAACMCCEASGVLIVSREGKGLHLEGQDLKAGFTPGGRLYDGMGVRNKDRAAICIPYQRGNDVLILTQNGKAIRLQETFELAPHKRGSFGAAIVRLDEGDQVLTAMRVSDAAVLLLSKEGRSLCVNLREIPAVRSAAKGVQTMSLKPGQAIAAIAMLQRVDGD